jgi:hypothetical protein
MLDSSLSPRKRSHVVKGPSGPSCLGFSAPGQQAAASPTALVYLTVLRISQCPNAEMRLDQQRVGPLIRQHVSGAVSEHVGMDVNGMPAASALSLTRFTAMPSRTASI